MKISRRLHTKYWKVNPFTPQNNMRRVLEAAANIAGGGIVAFPTETVYGLGGRALCPEAVEKIFLAKGRPGDNPLIVHIAYFWQAPFLVRKYQLKRKCWPADLAGSSYLVMPKSPAVPEAVTAGLDTWL